MNLFNCGEEISKLAVYSNEKYFSSQSAAKLSIYQNIFKNYSLKKNIFKTAPLKNTFSKLLSQKTLIS